MDAQKSTAWATLRGAVVWEGLSAVAVGLSGKEGLSAEHVNAAPSRVWSVLDAGGGTGGLAVPLAELGHQVVVVDPSPDSLAALERRASDRSVAGRVRWVQGDLSQLPELVAAGVVGSELDLVLCHSVLEFVDDPRAGVQSAAGVLGSGGLLSIVAATRGGAVMGRAVAGHFADAASALASDDARWSHDTVARRFDRAELVEMVEAAGLSLEVIHGIRVVSDIVPGSLLDTDSGAAAKLLDLERALSVRPEFLDVATQIHLVARKP